MNPITVKEIVKATGGTLLMGKPGDVITGVKHDSRECGADDLFTAIIGENQDAHKYIGQVLENGCRAVLVSREGEWLKQAEALGAAVVLVEDTVYAMGELAKYYLDTLNVKKIAVTGSVGKTSVRDMIYYVVNEKYRCGRNLKNFNNFIGLPLSIFQFDDSLEVGKYRETAYRRDHKYRCGTYGIPGKPGRYFSGQDGDRKAHRRG